MLNNLNNMEGKNTIEDLLEISRKIEVAAKINACHWKQCSRKNWIANRDRNNGAFHAQASKRRKKDTIKGLFNVNGEWKKEENEKAQIIKEHFLRLFTTSNPTSSAIAEVVDKIDRRLVATDDILYLSQPYDNKEVKDAVFEMHPTKAPGPDGFNARFFQVFWPVIGDGVTKQVLQVLNEGALTQGWNDTLICLFRKLKSLSIQGIFDLLVSAIRYTKL